MSISDHIIVMKGGVVQQTGNPQDVYDSPANLFVAKFLGTPPINVFRGQIKNSALYIGKNKIWNLKNAADQEIIVGIRPEGFLLSPQGCLSCDLNRIEVMGRDISIISTHEACENTVIRSIITAENRVNTASPIVRFDLRPDKVFLFSQIGEERIFFERKEEK